MSYNTSHVIDINNTIFCTVCLCLYSIFKISMTLLKFWYLGCSLFFYSKNYFIFQLSFHNDLDMPRLMLTGLPMGTLFWHNFKEILRFYQENMFQCQYVYLVFLLYNVLFLLVIGFFRWMVARNDHRYFH